MEATFVRRVWNYFRVKSAIKHAKKMRAKTRKQYFVLKVFNRIRVYDREHINRLIDAKILHKKLRNSLELTKYSIFYTN